MRILELYDWFWCKLSQVVHGSRARNHQLQSSALHRSEIWRPGGGINPNRRIEIGFLADVEMHTKHNLDSSPIWLLPRLLKKSFQVCRFFGFKKIYIGKYVQTQIPCSPVPVLYWTCTEDYGRRLLPLRPHLYPHLKSLKPFNFNNSNLDFKNLYSPTLDMYK